MLQRLIDTKYAELDKEGHLQLAPSLGPACDVHAHLALSYVKSGEVDLARDVEPEVYLDGRLPLDLDVYMNENFDPASMGRMKRSLSVGSLIKQGMRATHTGPALQRSMARANIQRTVILAIDFPIGTSNTDAYLTVASGHEGLIPAAAIHPLARNAVQLLRDAHARGARCMKMHPAVQQLRPDHPKAMRLYEICGELKMPVMWHCGPVGIVSKAADERCRVKHYWEPVHTLPQTTFVLGHTGALQYEMGVKLARMYENVYVEVACQGRLAIEHILKNAPTERILNGSDFPFYHQAVSIVKIALATEGNEPLRRKVLSENFDRLFPLSTSDDATNVEPS